MWDLKNAYKNVGPIKSASQKCDIYKNWNNFKNIVGPIKMHTEKIWNNCNMSCLPVATRSII